MERRAIAVRGIVQGVGFRPFVYGLASRLDLRGFVRNETDRVLIEIEGDPQSLDRFQAELRASPPPLARIDEVVAEPLPPVGEDAFRIEDSRISAAVAISFSPDVATCDACLAELFDPADRRYLYPFINCTHCGPRLTIVTGAPYDRVRTTMAAFAMCAACRADYADPRNRRFHAQPIACPSCGPRVRLRDADGTPVAGDPLWQLACLLRDGRIAAVKGLGGYHLVCDATDGAAIAEMRHRKRRDEKSFAVMARDLDAAAGFCEISAAERALLLSPSRPIVLLRRRTAGGAQAPHPLVAPGNPLVGVMLPYTPLHHLLMRGAHGVPLVMTSGNRSDEPIAIDDDDAAERLRGVADLFLTHDRPIHVRCDDSVTRAVGGVELLVRRSRGYAPRPILLSFECRRPILAVGGHLKNTFAFGRGRQAIVSHHIGDLDEYLAWQAFVRDIELYGRLFDMEPAMIAHDLHPDYASTRYAAERAQPADRAAVQHHHAHVASCLAEHGVTSPVIGVAFDGAGYGHDGAIWGGEFLVGDCREVRRAAHLRYVPLPGGEAAIREPWRVAVAHLWDAGEDPFETPVAGRVRAPAMRTVVDMIERRINAPPTSSVGRLFDAIAALAGVRDRTSFEGQAAMELEWQAAAVAPDIAYPIELSEEVDPIVVDTRPLVRAAARDVAAAVAAPVVARRLHSSVVDMIALVCGEIRERSGLDAVVLSGGVFLNEILTREAVARLAAHGFRVFRHRLVPPGDGGLSLGQVAVAAARDRD